MRGNDSVSMGVSLPWLALRLALLGVVAIGAAVLSPLIGWLIAALVLGVIGAALPQSFGAWGAVICFLIGMMIAGPDLGRTMLAVLIVHAIHILTTVNLVVPIGARIAVSVLRPTARRFLIVQVIAQPLTLLVMLGTMTGAVEIPWAVVAGAVALLVLVAVLIVSAKTGESGEG